MRSRTACAAILCCLAIGLTGCSTTSAAKSSGEKHWWQSLSFKSKKSENVASNNAPAAPTFGSTASPTVTMPASYANAGSPYGATQYPVTPYPPTTVPGGYAANAAPAGGYMPPSDPYATAATAYGAPQASNPYVAANAAPQATAPTQQANPYAAPATQAAPAYSTADQYNAYQGAPAAAGTTPYSYR
jgi:hypothetical protein